MPLPRGLFPRGEVPAQLSLKNRATDRRAASCESTGAGEEHSNIWLGASLISALQHPTAGANGCPTPPPTPLGTHLSLCLSPSLYSRSSARGWGDLRSSWFLRCKPGGEEKELGKLEHKELSSPRCEARAGRAQRVCSGPLGPCPSPLRSRNGRGRPRNNPGCSRSGPRRTPPCSGPAQRGNRRSSPRRSSTGG